jgi:hypothetical protein
MAERRELPPVLAVFAPRPVVAVAVTALIAVAVARPVVARPREQPGAGSTQRGETDAREALFGAG